MKRWLSIALVLVMAAGGAFWLLRSDGTLLKPDDVAVTEHGAEVYAEACASYHGDALQGQPNWREPLPNGRLPAPPHDETGHTWHHPDADLFAITKYGTEALVGGDYKSDMPGYAKILSDDDIVAVLSFIKASWPAEIRARHDEVNERGSH
ncbi:MAG: cytochrome c [Alphaproteobacteria bacterium]|nr:cytochrome c [Alphaproteobacteria bacterium]